MTLLYRVGDEIAIEASAEALDFVLRAITQHLVTYPQVHRPKLKTEVIGFANAIRAHLQHLQQVPSDNMDLV